MDRQSISEYARQLGRMPKKRQYERVCPMCGTTFSATVRGMYDKPACRVKAHKLRERAKKGSVEGKSEE